jgi:tetratricopeptide (TPR) repeat protein
MATDTAPTSPGWLRWLAPAIPVGAAFVLALTRIEDPDAFTHLALGRDLVQQRGFPAHEPFSFASADSPYHNTEWLFDVVLYLGFLAGGTAGIVLLKAAIVALAVAILWLDSRAWGEGASLRPAGLLTRAAVITTVVVMMRHRFVERPDIALMVFLAFTIYALNAHLATGRRWIFLLPALQVVWANTHPSVLVGLVPFVAVLGGGVALRGGARLGRHWWPAPAPAIPSWGRLATVAAVLVAVVVASGLNPYRFEVLTLPFELADVTWFRHEIGELQPLRPSLWPGPFVLAGFLLLSLLATLTRLPLVPALLTLPFALLALSALRFVFLFLLVAAPILARNLVVVAARAQGGRGRGLVLGGAAAALALAVTGVAVTAAGVGPFNDARKPPALGVGVDARRVPEGALRYLDARGIEGRVFNTFHFGGYITWRDFPRRIPIIDGRAHVSRSLLEQIHFAHVSPPHLERLRARYGLEAAVMEYPSYPGHAIEDVIGPDADPALASPDWALVFWDDVALVYLPRRGRYAAVVERDEYRHVKPASGVAGLPRLLADRGRAEAVRAELSRNVAETGSSLGLLLLGHATADADQAIATFARVQDPARRFEADQAIAAAYRRRREFARATEYYERALARDNGAIVLYNAGLVRAEAGDDVGAVRYLSRAQRADPHLADVYPALIAAHRRLGDEDSARGLGPAFLAAATRARVDQHLRNARHLLAGGQMAAAGAEVSAALRLDPRNALALSTLGFVRMAERRFDEAVQAEEQALAVDPRHAHAHWALAHIARARGDEPTARRHLETFARLAPRSYEAWQAREALAARPGAEAVSSGTPPAGPRPAPVPGRGSSPGS